MNITPQQAHKAFYQAAENIERNPELYNFDIGRVGGPDCPGCMWSNVGRCLGLDSNLNSVLVARTLGLRGEDLYTKSDFNPGGFDHPETNWKFSSSGDSRAKHAAARLRAFADAKWPQPIITHEPAEYSFSELVESLGVAA